MLLSCINSKIAGHARGHEKKQIYISLKQYTYVMAFHFHSSSSFKVSYERIL